MTPAALQKLRLKIQELEEIYKTESENAPRGGNVFTAMLKSRIDGLREALKILEMEF